jgi:hypothetical protein
MYFPSTGGVDVGGRIQEGQAWEVADSAGMVPVTNVVGIGVGDNSPQPVVRGIFCTP